MYCSNCGKEVHGKFCSNCGAPVENQGAQKQPDIVEGTNIIEVSAENNEPTLSQQEPVKKKTKNLVWCIIFIALALLGMWSGPLSLIIFGAAAIYFGAKYFHPYADERNVHSGILAVATVAALFVISFINTTWLNPQGPKTVNGVEPYGNTPQQEKRQEYEYTNRLGQTFSLTMDSTNGENLLIYEKLPSELIQEWKDNIALAEQTYQQKNVLIVTEGYIESINRNSFEDYYYIKLRDDKKNLDLFGMEEIEVDFSVGNTVDSLMNYKKGDYITLICSVDNSSLFLEYPELTAVFVLEVSKTPTAQNNYAAPSGWNDNVSIPSLQNFVDTALSPIPQDEAMQNVGRNLEDYDLAAVYGYAASRISGEDITEYLTALELQGFAYWETNDKDVFLTCDLTSPDEWAISVYKKNMADGKPLYAEAWIVNGSVVLFFHGDYSEEYKGQSDKVEFGILLYEDDIATWQRGGDSALGGVYENMIQNGVSESDIRNAIYDDLWEYVKTGNSAYSGKLMYATILDTYYEAHLNGTLQNILPPEAYQEFMNKINTPHD